MAGETPDEVTLSVEDAVAQLTASDAPSEATQAEQSPPDDEPEDIEDDADAEDGEAEPEAEPEPEPDAIDAPKSWSASEKAKFASLDRESQEIIAARENDRDKTVSKALSEKDRAIKQATEQAAHAAADFRAKAEQVVPEALRRMAEWDKLDLVALHDRDPAAATRAALQRDQERADFTKLQADIKDAQNIEYRAHVSKLVEDLPSVVPDLVDPEKGSERVNEVGRFLTGMGIPQDQIAWITAPELSVAYDAMRWRQSQDTARKAVTARPASSPPTRPVRPAGSAPRSSQQSAVETANRRLTKSGSIDDAVALLMLKGAT